MAIRHFLWSDGEAWRIPKRLHEELVAGRAQLPQYANTKQNVVEAIFEPSGRLGKDVTLRCTVYIFDNEGRLNLSDQADAVATVFTRASIDQNVTNIRTVLKTQRWEGEHAWTPPEVLINKLEAELFSKGGPDTEKLPVLRATKIRRDN